MVIDKSRWPKIGLSEETPDWFVYGSLLNVENLPIEGKMGEIAHTVDSVKEFLTGYADLTWHLISYALGSQGYDVKGWLEQEGAEMSTSKIKGSEWAKLIAGDYPMLQDEVKREGIVGEVHRNSFVNQNGGQLIIETWGRMPREWVRSRPSFQTSLGAVEKALGEHIPDMIVVHPLSKVPRKEFLENKALVKDATGKDLLVTVDEFLFRIGKGVDSGMIGEPVIGRAYRAGPMPIRGGWAADKRKSGGVILDLSIHDIDFILWCFQDRVTSVFAKLQKAVNRGRTTADLALINLKFCKGGIALVEGSWGHPRAFPFTTKLELNGAKGMISFDSQATVPVRLTDDQGTVTFSPEALRGQAAALPFAVDPFYREIQHFVDCIREDRVPMTSGEESRKGLEVALAAMRSAATGKVVELPLEEAR